MSARSATCSTPQAPEAEREPLSFSAAAKCPAFEVPDEIADAVREKQRKDEIADRRADPRGTPVAPINTGVDGGMHPVFAAKRAEGQTGLSEGGDGRACRCCRWPARPAPSPPRQSADAHRLQPLPARRWQPVRGGRAGSRTGARTTRGDRGADRKSDASFHSPAWSASAAPDGHEAGRSTSAARPASRNPPKPSRPIRAKQPEAHRAEGRRRRSTNAGQTGTGRR